LFDELMLREYILYIINLVTFQPYWQISIPILLTLGSESKTNEAPNILKGRYADDKPKVNISCPSFLKPKVPIFPCLE
jgi:hypothetical protein